MLFNFSFFNSNVGITGGPDAQLFKNRKHFYSINVQVVCNAHLEVIDVVARWPGSVHDSTIFDNSRLKTNFRQGIYEDGLLIGDAGYPRLPFLLTPLDNVRTAPEYLYNESLIRVRGLIERFFGIWSQQWGFINGSRYQTVERTLTTITALAILHNIARKKYFRWIGKRVADVQEYTQNIHNNLQIDNRRDTRQQAIEFFHR